MNLQTNIKKQKGIKHISIKLLMLIYIATFSLCICLSGEIKAEATNNLVFDKEIGVPVLLFHKFMDSPKDIKHPDIEITLDYFENVLKYLTANKYSTISFQQLYSYIKNGTPIPSKSIVLSIDDGFYADGAIKLLKEYDMHADLAVVGKRCKKGIITDPNNYYSWKQIIKLARDRDGDIIDVVDHTSQHIDLKKLSKNPYKLKQLLKSSMNIFKQQLGSSPYILVYPYGNYNNKVEEIAAQAGYKMGVTTDKGLNYYGDNPFTIKRYEVNQNVSIEELFDKINTDRRAN